MRRAPVVQAQVPMTKRVPLLYYFIYQFKNTMLFYYFTGASDEGSPKVYIIDIFFLQNNID